VAVRALDAKTLVERVHERADLLARPGLRQHLQVGGRSGGTALAATRSRTRCRRLLRGHGCAREEHSSAQEIQTSQLLHETSGNQARALSYTQLSEFCPGQAWPDRASRWQTLTRRPPP